jgi:hypothetical protein
MNIDGFTDHEIAGISKRWNLGNPIEVGAFLHRQDIPESAKESVRRAGRFDMPARLTPKPPNFIAWRKPNHHRVSDARQGPLK